MINYTQLKNVYNVHLERTRSTDRDTSFCMRRCCEKHALASRIIIGVDR